MWEEWDVRRSLFDSHVAESMEANLAYMWKNFGFYFPEAELLADPEGLLKYLVRCPATLGASDCTGLLPSTAWQPGCRHPSPRLGYAAVRPSAPVS